MSIGVLQEKATDTSATVASLALAFTSAVTASSSIHGSGSGNFNTGTGSMGDNNGSASYGAALDSILDAGNVVTSSHFSVDSHAAGATTVTWTPPSSVAFVGIAIREIGSTSGRDGSGTTHSGVLDTAPGAGANAITGTAVTPSTQPGLISVFIVDPSAAGNLAAGTSPAFSLGLAHTNYPNLGQMITEHLRYTATSAITATAGDSTGGGSHHYTVLIALFKETTPPAPAVPIPKFYFVLP